MQIDIITLFPDMFSGPFAESIIKRAIDRDLITINLHNLRNWGQGKHKVVDDYPFGGGSGMVMKPEPIFEAVESIKIDNASAPVILLTPQGRVFNQRITTELAAYENMIFICG